MPIGGELAQYGATGVIIALIMVLAWLMKSVFDYSKQCREDVVKVMKDGHEVNKKQTEATEVLAQAVHALRERL